MAYSCLNNFYTTLLFAIDCKQKCFSWLNKSEDKNKLFPTFIDIKKGDKYYKEIISSRTIHFFAIHKYLQTDLYSTEKENSFIRDEALKNILVSKSEQYYNEFCQIKSRLLSGVCHFDVLK